MRLDSHVDADAMGFLRFRRILAQEVRSKVGADVRFGPIETREYMCNREFHVAQARLAFLEGDYDSCMTHFDAAFEAARECRKDYDRKFDREDWREIGLSDLGQVIDSHQAEADIGLERHRTREKIAFLTRKQ